MGLIHSTVVIIKLIFIFIYIGNQNKSLPQRIDNGTMAINSDGRQCKHRHIHADRLYEWQEWAHEMRQIPSLQNRCLKL